MEYLELTKEEEKDYIQQLYLPLQLAEILNCF